MRRWLGHIITSAIGLVVMGFCVLFQDAECRNAADWMLVLSNAALVPGVFLCGFGFLAVISSEGLFDAAKYTFGAIMNHMRKTEKKYESYYDYYSRDHKEKRGMGFMILPGAVFLLLAAVFAGIFYIV